jgi:multicomponent K+:H+ antiporter subunit E
MKQTDNPATKPTKKRFRLLPRPRLTLFLLVLWLLLNNTIAPGHILLGAIIGMLIPILTHPLTLPSPGINRPLMALKYIGVFNYDIVVSNLEVALLICGSMRKLTPGIIAVPLDLEDDLLITLLASTISLTPGTVSAELSDDRRWLYVHALHLQDEQAAIERIKTRYEQPLREMFK